MAASASSYTAAKISNEIDPTKRRTKKRITTDETGKERVMTEKRDTERRVSAAFTFERKEVLVGLL